MDEEVKKEWVRELKKIIEEYVRGVPYNFVCEITQDTRLLNYIIRKIKDFK